MSTDDAIYLDDDAHGGPLTIGLGLALWRSLHRLDPQMRHDLMSDVEPVEARHSTVRLLARLLATYGALAARFEPDPISRISRYQLPLEARLHAALSGSPRRRTTQAAFTSALVRLASTADGGAPEERPELWQLVAATDRRLVSIFVLTDLLDAVAAELDAQFSLAYHDLVNDLEASLLASKDRP